MYVLWGKLIMHSSLKMHFKAINLEADYIIIGQHYRSLQVKQVCIYIYYILCACLHHESG